MKKVILILTLAIVTVFALVSISFADEMNPKSIEAVLSEIKMEQGINDSDKIDPSKVSQSKLEELGDSVMEVMIGNSAMHDQMDIRLGGDGSASLKAFHINIGLNYLSDYPNGMMDLMSGGMMGYNNAYSNSEWNGYNIKSYLEYIIVAIGLLLLLLFIIVALVIRYTLRSRGAISIHDTSLEILGVRYAKGEITKDEFDKMTKNIKALK
jgi:putative membrane protein